MVHRIPVILTAYRYPLRIKSGPDNGLGQLSNADAYGSDLRLQFKEYLALVVVTKERK